MLQRLQNGTLKIVNKNKFIKLNIPSNLEQLLGYNSISYHYEEFKQRFTKFRIITKKT